MNIPRHPECDEPRFQKLYACWSRWLSEQPIDSVDHLIDEEMHTLEGFVDCIVRDGTIRVGSHERNGEMYYAVTVITADGPVHVMTVSMHLVADPDLVERERQLARQLGNSR